MSERRKAGAKNRTLAYIAAALVHLLLIGVLLFNFTNNEPRATIEAFDADKIDTVKASVIDESQIKDQQEKLKKAEREREAKKREKKKREEDELKKIKQQADQEKQKVADLKAQQELEKKKLEAIALNKKKAEDERKKKEAERKKKKAEEDKKRKAKEAKAAKEKRARDAEDAERRDRLSKALADEEAERQQREADRRAKERTTTVMSQYSARIEQAIKAKWRVAPGTEPWRVAKINIKLSPDGRVLKVVVINSSGSVDYDRSVETAVLQASPLPFPTQEEDLTAHQTLQDININVKQ